MFFKSGFVGRFGEIVVAMVDVNFLSFCLFEPLRIAERDGEKSEKVSKGNTSGKLREIMNKKHAKGK